MGFQFFKDPHELDIKKLTEVIYTALQLTDRLPPLYKWTNNRYILDALLYQGVITPSEHKKLIGPYVDSDELIPHIEDEVCSRFYDQHPKAFRFKENLVACYICAVAMLNDTDSHFCLPFAKGFHIRDRYFDSTMYNIGAIDEIHDVSHDVSLDMEPIRNKFRCSYYELPEQTWNELKTLHIM